MILMWRRRTRARDGSLSKLQLRFCNVLSSAIITLVLGGCSGGAPTSVLQSTSSLVTQSAQIHSLIPSATMSNTQSTKSPPKQQNYYAAHLKNGKPARKPQSFVFPPGTGDGAPYGCPGELAHFVTGVAGQPFTSPATPTGDQSTPMLTWEFTTPWPLLWDGQITPSVAQYPDTVTISGTVPSGTPPGTYVAIVQWNGDNGDVSACNPVVVTVGGPSPSPSPTPSPPPAPTVDEASLSPKLGQTAKFNLTDAATPDMGALTWNVTVDDQTQAPYTLKYQTTNGPPHTNALSFKTDNTTKPGRYSISVSVTSQTTGETSPSTLLTMSAIYAFKYTEKASLEKYTEDGLPAPVAESAFAINPPIETLLAQYNDGSSDVADVDASSGGTGGTSGTASTQKGRVAISARRYTESLSGTALDHNCSIIHTLAADAVDGKITVWPYWVKCDKPAEIGQVHVILTRLDTSGSAYTNVLDEASVCGGADVCITPDKTDLPVTNGSGYYTAQIVVAVNNGETTAQIGFKLTDTFFYNDNNAIYPYLAGYNQPSPVPYPVPPIINCRAGATTSGCPKYSGRALRINLIDYYDSTGQQGLVPPGVTKQTSPGYEAHHIKQGSCGGNDDVTNGVFLVKADHTTFTTWFRKLAPCGQDTSD
jgi:hypothetical protein